MIELVELSVCSDCIMVIANGELPPDSDKATDDLLIGGTIGVMYGGDDLGFSWKPCDCCKRKLGGGRYMAYKPIETV